MTFQATRQAALALSADERWQLVEELWSSLTDERQLLSPDQLSDLDSRLASLEANPGDVIPWEVARARLLNSGPDE